MQSQNNWFHCKKILKKAVCSSNFLYVYLNGVVCMVWCKTKIEEKGIAYTFMLLLKNTSVYLFVKNVLLSNKLLFTQFNRLKKRRNTKLQREGIPISIILYLYWKKEKLVSISLKNWSCARTAQFTKSNFLLHIPPSYTNIKKRHDKVNYLHCGILPPYLHDFLGQNVNKFTDYRKLC